MSPDSQIPQNSVTQKNSLSSPIVMVLIGVLCIVVGIGIAWIIFKPGSQPPPTPESEPTLIAKPEGIRSISELATVEYLAVIEMQNESIPDDIRSWAGVKEEILMLIYGDVKAGFDLSKLSENDLKVDGTEVELTLPAPEILSISVDNKRTHVVLRDKSLFVGLDKDLESKTRLMADEALRKSAIEDENILEKASKYGQLYFENYLRSLGFTKVQVIVKSPGL